MSFNFAISKNSELDDYIINLDNIRHAEEVSTHRKLLIRQILQIDDSPQSPQPAEMKLANKGEAL